MTDLEVLLAKSELRKTYQEKYGEIYGKYEVTLATKEDCLKEIERQSILSEICDLDGYFKDRYSNPYQREVYRLQNLLCFYDSGVDWRLYGDGYIRVTKGNKGYPLLYVLLSSKWRQEGKSVWYKSKDSKSFLEKFVYHQGYKHGT